ncbi:MAG TPA: hypothetical protein VIK12_09595 [Pengzhenrongella sp.]
MHLTFTAADGSALAEASTRVVAPETNVVLSGTMVIATSRVHRVVVVLEG